MLLLLLRVIRHFPRAWQTVDSGRKFLFVRLLRLLQSVFSTAASALSLPSPHTQRSPNGQAAFSIQESHVRRVVPNKQQRLSPLLACLYLSESFGRENNVLLLYFHLKWDVLPVDVG